MGVVYKARHRGLNRLVALKVIRGGSFASPDLIGRLPHRGGGRRSPSPREHRAGLRRRRDGRRAVPSHWSFSKGGRSPRSSPARPSPNRSAAEMCRTLALAMHAAHRAGIIHRDLKPLNVLIDEAGQAQDRRLRAGQASRGRVGPDAVRAR